MIDLRSPRAIAFVSHAHSIHRMERFSLSSLGIDMRKVDLEGTVRHESERFAGCVRRLRTVTDLGAVIVKPAKISLSLPYQELCRQLALTGLSSKASVPAIIIQCMSYIHRDHSI